MTLAGVGARALLVPLRADLSPGRRGRRQAAWLQFCPQCSLPNTGNPISGGNRAGDDDRLSRDGSRLTDRCPASRTGIGAVQPGVAQGRENDCAPSRLRSRQREGAASRRGRPTRGRKFGDLGRHVSDANLPSSTPSSPAGEARSAASGGVDGAPDVDRARALPALARDIDRLIAAVTDGDASQRRRVENMPAAPKASLPALLAAYAAVRQRRCGRT